MIARRSCRQPPEGVFRDAALPATRRNPTRRRAAPRVQRLHDHRVDDATYERVVKRFGDRGIVDLAGLIGYYSFVSVTLNVFEVPTPPGAKLLEK